MMAAFVPRIEYITTFWNLKLALFASLVKDVQMLADLSFVCFHDFAF